MSYKIPTHISNLIESQFPNIYKEDGPNFVLFMKAYYEWMESAWDDEFNGYGGPVRESRELLEYRDIDETIVKFLEYFQKKYLYGIPFEVISNKRFLLKHILDVYRSKGSIQCYRLLFKLLYDEDIEVYIPGRDLLRPSEGIWRQPKYLEVTGNSLLESYVGQTIIGSSSRITGIVESYSQEYFNDDIVHILHLSNTSTRDKDFEIGEKVVLYGEQSDTSKVELAPAIKGSLHSLEITNGGQGFNVGDIIKIVHKDLDTKEVISYGSEGILRVSSVSSEFGTVNFSILDSGSGFTDTTKTFVYRSTNQGEGASFEIGNLSSTRIIEYNTDILGNYLTVSLDATAYGLPKDISANLTSTIGSALQKESQTFGSILTLDNIFTGNNYAAEPYVFARPVQTSLPMYGNVAYSTTSNTIVGTNTDFDYFFSNDDVIGLKYSSTVSEAEYEYAVIKEVISNTEITLYGPPSTNSMANAQYMAAPTILPSNFAPYDLYSNSSVYPLDGGIPGEDETIKAVPSSGNNAAATAVAVNSGKSYVENEEVIAYLHGGIASNVEIVYGGTGYANGELLLFAGTGDNSTTANGYISTNSTGGIISAYVSSGGSGYFQIPEVRVITANGTGATLRASIQEFNTYSGILGKVRNGGLGYSRGYWVNNRSFLDSNKYIQDSYYYQDYSYEIKVAKQLSKYKKIIQDTFHIAGTELFGSFLKSLAIQSSVSLLRESTLLYEDNWGADSGNTIVFRSSSNVVSVDSNTITSDVTIRDYTNYLSVDNVEVRADNRKFVRYVYASGTQFRASDSRVTVDRYFV